jgi:hypothetical protein
MFVKCDHVTFGKWKCAVKIELAQYGDKILRHKAHTSKKLGAPWTWPKFMAETCRSGTKQTLILRNKLAVKFVYVIQFVTCIIQFHGKCMAVNLLRTILGPLYCIDSKVSWELEVVYGTAWLSSNWLWPPPPPNWGIIVLGTPPPQGRSDIPKELITEPIYTFYNNHKTRPSISYTKTYLKPNLCKTETHL